MTPAVSVALCTHNGERFIAEQLRSVVAQSLPPVEVVLSDDASTDATVALAHEVLDGSGIALRVLRNDPALGVTANFERAILATDSEFVVLCDQDDSWHPRRIESALAVFAANPALWLVHSDAHLVDGVGMPLGTTLFEALGIGDRELAAIRRGDAFSLLLRRNLVTGATVMLRRELAVAAAPFPVGWLHDEWLAIVAAVRGGVDVVADQLVDYRQHGGNEVGAERLGLAGRIRRMVESGSERSARLLARAESLAERLPALAPERADEAQDTS